jgi:VanZ family protein
MRKFLPFAVFALFLGLLTWKLLEPSPVPESLRQGLTEELMFILFKVAHAGSYAFLTLLAAWLPVRRPYFWAAVGVLALHGCLTEYLQFTMAVGRTGTVRDVLIDWGGIALGLAFLRVSGLGRLSASGRGAEPAPR